MRREFGERAQTGRESFLLDQPSRLHEPPAAIGRPFSPNEWCLGHWNSGAMNANFLLGAAEANDGVAQRARADENETDRFHHLFPSPSRCAGFSMSTMTSAP